MMMRCVRFSMILMACFTLSLLNAGIITTAYAAQDKPEAVHQDRPGEIYGKVTEVINVAGYTYAEVDTGKEKMWAAGPPTSLKAGDMVAFSSQMPMQNFHSKTIGRDFPVIYFINNYITNKEISTTASAHDQIKQQISTPIEGINKVEGGNTIAEIHTDKNKLKGKIVKVRGKVTKFTANIMGKNWLHIRDSSSLDDLTATSDSSAVIGDIVIVEGKLELDQDFGYGYIYPVILQQTTLTKE